MPSNLILNEKILASSQFTSGSAPPPVRLTLSGLKFSHVAIDGNTLLGYMLVTYHHKPIAIFGRSPDRSDMLTPDALKKFYERYQIKRIYCLDQRRNQCLAEELETKIKNPSDAHFQLDWLNLHKFERSLNIDIYNAYNGVRFDLADKFTINLYKFSQSEIETLQSALSQLEPTSLGNAKLPNTAKINQLRKEQYDCHSLKNHYGEHHQPLAQKFINQLRYYPSPTELHAFMNSMNEAHYAKEMPIIYCAGGVGRTALYLTFWIQEMCQCSLVTAMQVVAKVYFAEKMQEVKSFLDYMKFNLSPKHRKELTRYAQSGPHLWQQQTITQSKNNIANELLEETHISHTVIREYATRIQQVNRTNQKHPENGRLYNILQSIAEDIGLSPQELRPQQQ